MYQKSLPSFSLDRLSLFQRCVMESPQVEILFRAESEAFKVYYRELFVGCFEVG